MRWLAVLRLQKCEPWRCHMPNGCCSRTDSFSAGDGAAATSEVSRLDNPIHCARRSLIMAFRPLLRQVSSWERVRKSCIDVSQRAFVPAIAAAVTTGAVFAPRIVHAEEHPADVFVRLLTFSVSSTTVFSGQLGIMAKLTTCDRTANPSTTTSRSTQQLLSSPHPHQTHLPIPIALHLPTVSLSRSAMPAWPSTSKPSAAKRR